jgi:hypothetical protein
MHEAGAATDLAAPNPSSKSNSLNIVPPGPVIGTNTLPTGFSENRPLPMLSERNAVSTRSSPSAASPRSLSSAAFSTRASASSPMSRSDESSRIRLLSRSSVRQRPATFRSEPSSA